MKRMSNRPGEIEEETAPPGVVVFANDERFTIEVRRTLPVIATGATLMTVALAIALTRGWGNTLAEIAIFGNCAYWLWPRVQRTFRLTTIDFYGGDVKFAQIGVTGQEVKTVPTSSLGLPKIVELRIERYRLPDVRLRCLQFDHYVDGGQGGQSIPLQILAGYREKRLAWICKSIGSRMRTFAKTD